MKNLCLQSNANIINLAIDTTFYCLTGGDVSTNLDTVLIELSYDDSAAIKILLHQLYGKHLIGRELYLSFIYNTAQDLSTNYLPAISSSSALLINSIMKSNKKPYIKSMTFSLDYTQQASITLYFSDPVNTTLLQDNMLMLIIQNRYASRDGVMYQLTGGLVASSVLAVVTIELTAVDVVSMKLIPGLIRSMRSTYLVIATNLTTDLEGKVVYMLTYITHHILYENHHISSTSSSSSSSSSSS